MRRDFQAGSGSWARGKTVKVLHLIAGNLYGGIEVGLTTMARLRHLAPTMESQFGLCFRGRSWDELVATDAAVHDLGPVRLSRPWTVRRARRRLERVLGETRPDVVVTHDSWPHTVFAPQVRRAGILLVLSIHGLPNVRHWLDRWASRTRPDLLVANSRFTAAVIKAMYPAIPVEVWHAPRALPVLKGSVRSEVRSEFGTADDTVVIVQVSRLEQWKGHAVHLAALGRLRDVPGWECWIAGGVQKAGEARFLDELRTAASRVGISDRVRFLGQRADVPRLMAASDVFCQPNTGPEPFGFVFVEALHARLPVVTSNFGGAVEIVDRSCGVLTKPGDPEAVAEALRNLILDPTKRSALGATGPDRAQFLCDPTRQLNAAAALFGRVEARKAIGRPGSAGRRGVVAKHLSEPSTPPARDGGAAANGRMKVLHLYAGNLYGGIETFLTTLARARHLAPTMEPEFGLCFRGRLWEELVAAGVTVHDLGCVRLSRPWTVWRARARLRQVFVASRPDVVATHDSWPHVVFAREAARAGIGLVQFVHGPLSGRHWLERLARRTPADLVVANSEFTARSMREVSPKARIAKCTYPVTRRFVDKPVRSHVRSELSTADTAVVILQASRLERWKGQPVLLAALGLLRDLPCWACWLAGGVQKAGERQFLDELRARAEQAGIADRVRFLGDRADIPRLMAAADVYCQPNTGPEPFGIVLVEALHAGLPVVTSGFGGAVEIVDETCGVLTPPGDAVAVAEALKSLIHEPSRRQAFGAAGPARAESLCDAARQLNAAARLLEGTRVVR
jgi:glycosyltransferase involved in cell wall biosynthesis